MMGRGRGGERSGVTSSSGAGFGCPPFSALMWLFNMEEPPTPDDVMGVGGAMPHCSISPHRFHLPAEGHTVHLQELLLSTRGRSTF